MRLRCRCVRCTHIVGMQGVHGGTAVVRCRRCRWHPTVAVHVIVVGAHVTRAVHHARVWVVCRYCPHHRRAVQCARRAETQRLCRVVHVACPVEPDALQVYRHVNLLARVCIPAVDPQLVVCRVHLLGPHLVQQNVGLNLVLVAAVYHQLALAVQVAHRAVGLAAREVEHRRGARRDGPCHHNC